MARIARHSILLSMMLMGSASLGGCSNQDTGLHAGDIHAAVYQPSGASLDILTTGTVIALDGGCLGVAREASAEPMVLALAEGSSVTASGKITAVGDSTSTGKTLVFSVGDEITFTGSQNTDSAASKPELQLPSTCPTDTAIWYLLP